MTSLQSLKHIKSLRLSKFRQKYNQFTIEGLKSIDELIHSDYEIHGIYATKQHFDHFANMDKVHLLSDKGYASISQFKTPAGALAVGEIKTLSMDKILDSERLSLVLDGIADPGNLGTLIRTADWFGIKQIIASKTCADFYNHKTLSSTMGSFTRVHYFEGDLVSILDGKNTYGALLDGEPLGKALIEDPAFLVIGSESHGISKEVQAHIKNKVFIPGAGKTESLNASIAGGILMHEFYTKLK